MTLLTGATLSHTVRGGSRARGSWPKVECSSPCLMRVGHVARKEEAKRTCGRRPAACIEEGGGVNLRHVGRDRHVLRPQAAARAAAVELEVVGDADGASRRAHLVEVTAGAIAAVPPEMVGAVAAAPEGEVTRDVAYGVLIVLEEAVHVGAERGREEKVRCGRRGGEHLAEYGGEGEEARVTGDGCQGRGSD